MELVRFLIMEVVSMATLRKSDLVARVATKIGGTKSQAEDALNGVLGTLRTSLAAGDRVVLTGFGTFEVRQVKERKVRPIRGGAAGRTITVPAHNRVGFTAGAELAQAVRRPRRR
ncbi:MAG: HU family DNA-binding protein [Chloroflexi bacterium]|nr:HU family DNA-binding protein [Chloroflexota bacterium]